VLFCVENIAKRWTATLKVKVQLSVNGRLSPANTVTCANVAWNLQYERLANASAVCSLRAVFLCLLLEGRYLDMGFIVLFCFVSHVGPVNVHC